VDRQLYIKGGGGRQDETSNKKYNTHEQVRGAHAVRHVQDGKLVVRRGGGHPVKNFHVKTGARKVTEAHVQNDQMI